MLVYDANREHGLGHPDMYNWHFSCFANEERLKGNRDFCNSSQPAQAQL